jgi:hypothetical protein
MASGKRRLSRVVHDHKGNASVEWYDAPSDHPRDIFEIAATGKHLVDAGSLSVHTEDSFNPYTRVPEGDAKKGAPRGKTDLRKLSAWIKMMRELEEAKKRRDEED